MNSLHVGNYKQKREKVSVVSLQETNLQLQPKLGTSQK